MSPAELRDGVADSDRIIRPPDDHYLDYRGSKIEAEAQARDASR
jgi:hypothetical protein